MPAAWKSRGRESQKTMGAGRPRAHSASSIKFNLVNPPQENLKKGNSRSTPELRSMLVGLETTVPLNLTPQDFASRHKPRARSLPRVKMGKKDTRTDSEATEGSRSCCRCRLVLVVLQTLLGMASTALALYLYLYVPATKLRDAPLWASGPLCVAGLVGIFYCATDFHVYAGSTKAFVIKTLCLMFSTLATFLCLIATVFPVIHLVRIFTYHRCREEEGDCVCALTSDPNPKVVVYDGLAVCDVVFTELQYSLIVSGSLCLLGSVASLWFVVLVWQGRYGRVYTGLDSASPTPIPEVIITEADLSPS